jgi:hypothetical protein
MTPRNHLSDEGLEHLLRERAYAGEPRCDLRIRREGGEVIAAFVHLDPDESNIAPDGVVTRSANGRSRREALMRLAALTETA